MRYKWLCAQRFLGFISSIPCKWELPRGKNKSWASSKACFATSLSNELILTAVAPCFSYKIQLGLHQQPPWTHPRTSGCRLNDAILRKGRWCCRCCRWRSKLGQPWFVGQSGMSHVSSCQNVRLPASSSSSFSASSSPLYQASPPPPPELLPPLSTTHLSND